MSSLVCGKHIRGTGSKELYEVHGHPDLLLIQCRDELAVRDGSRREQVPGSGKLTTDVICAVYQFLETCGVQTAFVERQTENSYVVRRCQIQPYMFVSRRSAQGSFLKRYPHVPAGTVFPRLVREMFLRTDGLFAHVEVGRNPLVRTYEPTKGDVVLHLFDPNQPMLPTTSPIRTLRQFPCRDDKTFPSGMQELAAHIFFLLERAWQIAGRQLIDLKIEYGMDPEGRLVVADAVESETWRIASPGEDLSRSFRDGATAKEALARLEEASECTRRFHLPTQQLVILVDSEVGFERGFDGGINQYLRVGHGGSKVSMEVCQPGEPMRALKALRRIVRDNHRVVVIVDGIDPVATSLLVQHATFPVIAMPSSRVLDGGDPMTLLQCCRGFPISIALEPKMAVQFAARILAMENPLIYATGQGYFERELENLIPLA